MFRRRRAIKLALLFALLLSSKISALFADSQIIFNDSSILNNEYVDISKRWDYYKSTLIEPESFYPIVKNLPGAIVNLPHIMGKGTTLATYHLRLSGLVPSKRYACEFFGAIMTSSRIWCNGKIVATGGFLSKERNLVKPGDINGPVDFQADQNGVIDIVIHVGNFEKCKGGIVKSIKISSSEKVIRHANINYLLNSLIFAFLLANILYNVILGSINYKQLSYLTLVIICALYCCAIYFTGYSVILLKGVNMPFWLYRKMPILILSFATSFDLLYIMYLHRTSTKKLLTIFSIAMANSLAVLFAPFEYYEKTKWLFADIALVLSFVRFFIPLKFVLRRNFDNKKAYQQTTAAYNLSSVLTLLIFFCRVNDFLILPHKYTIIHSYLMFKLSFLLFGIAQCGVYAYHRDFSSVRVNKQMEKLSYTNNTLAKIIPPQILKLLGASDVTKIIPSESRIIDALLFCVQIKHFNRLAESISKSELYSIQTEFFQAISPIIIDSGGFVAKYSISGCLAIFQQKNSDAIICASRLQRKMRELRRALRKTKRNDISVGIGIHSGKVAIGTIGANNRLDTMALSEDVNIAYAVASQTSKTNTQILITEEAMPYCRGFINYVYEGHYFIANGKQILVYSALPIKKNEQAFEDTLEPIEEEDEI